MRRFLDWVMNKFGYHRKWNPRPWPPVYLFPRGLEELSKDDVIYSKYSLRDLVSGKRHERDT